MRRRYAAQWAVVQWSGWRASVTGAAAFTSRFAANTAWQRVTSSLPGVSSLAVSVHSGLHPGGARGQAVATDHPAKLSSTATRLTARLPLSCIARRPMRSAPRMHNGKPATGASLEYGVHLHAMLRCSLCRPN